MTTANWNELATEHEIAHFRGSLAVDYPESYSIEEMREISEGMDISTAKIEVAMKSDFQSMPTHAQQRMMELLTASDPANIRFWEELLLGFSELPNRPPVAA